MRAIWSGALSFGLVNIPVKLYSAVTAESLDFDLLRKADLSPIKYVRVARADGREVPYDDIVRGYQYRKGDYVVLTEDDFRKADPRKTSTIEISDFVKREEVDDIYFEKPYYLEPVPGAVKPYALLVASLKQSGKVALARFVIRTKEHLGVVKPEGDLLVLEQLRFASEIKPPAGLKIPSRESASEREIEMALQLIEQMSAHFNPNNYKDAYREELLELIQEKAEKGTVQPRGEQVQATEFANLMAELKKSLKQAQAKR